MTRALDRVAGLARSRGASARDDGARGWIVPAYFLALALAVLSPLLGPGFVLSLDMVFSPTMRYTEYLLGAKDPLYYGRLPVALALDGMAIVVPHWLLQRAVLVSIVAGSGLAAFAACRDRTTPGALFAGTLYAINPFVFVRLLAGHWWFLLGYALLPLAVVAFARSLSDRSRSWRAAGWTTLACAFDPHVAVLAALAFAGVGTAAVVRSSEPRSVLGAAGRVGGVTAGLSAYWLLPALVSLGGRTTAVADMGSLDAFAFSARGTIAGNVPLSVAMLFGFWRDGDRLPPDALPLWVLLALVAAILLLAVDGAIDGRDDPLVAGVAVAGVVGFVLALGVTVDATAPLSRTLSDHVVVFRGMRDSQKFVALLALAYALLGARCVDRLVRWLDRSGGDGGSRGMITATGRDRIAALRVLLVLAVVLLPFAYAWPMPAGLGGQLSTTEYPEAWHEANDVVAADGEPGRVLFLPWHGYLSFPWSGGRIATPADAFFEGPVIRSRSVDHSGVRRAAFSPTHAAVDSLVDEPDALSGAALAPLGVRYVVVASVADHDRYGSLRSRPDLTVALENDRLTVYENAAFDRAPAPDRWPRSRPAVPRSALAVGTLVSVGTVVRRRRLVGAAIAGDG